MLMQIFAIFLVVMHIQTAPHEGLYILNCEDGRFKSTTSNWWPICVGPMIRNFYEISMKM